MKHPNFLKKIICLLKGHASLTRDTKTVSHYIKISAGRGAFCQDPERYEYDGWLYRCARCDELLLFQGIASWELEDLMKVTLQNLPQGTLELAFSEPHYDFARLYR